MRLGRFGKGALLGFFVNATAILLNLGVQFLFARALGAEELGQYAYVLSWLSILVLLAVSGIDSVSLRQVALFHAHDDRSKLRALIHWGNWRVLRNSLIIALLTAYVGWFYIPTLQYEFVLGACLLPFWALTINRQAICRGFKMVVAARVPDVIFRPVLQAILIITLVIGFLIPVDATLSMATHLVAAICALAFGWFFFKIPKPSTQENSRATSEDRREWRNAALRLLLIALMMVLFSELDKIFLGLFVSFTDVGIYSIASRIAAISVFGIEAVYTIAAPLISEYYATRTKEEFEQLLGRITLGMLLLSFPLIGATVVVAPWVLPFFGPEFSGAYVPLMVLCSGQALAALYGVGGFTLVMTGRDQLLLRTSLKSIIILIACVAIGTFSGGVTGAAAGTAIATVIRAALMHRAVREDLGITISIRHGLMSLRR